MAHLKKYYFKDNNYAKNKIDFVICSHSNQDHASGLEILFEHFKIDKLYVNLPWEYIGMYELENIKIRDLSMDIEEMNKES